MATRAISTWQYLVSGVHSVQHKGTGYNGLCLLKQLIALVRMVRDKMVGKHLLTSSELGIIFRASQV